MEHSRSDQYWKTYVVLDESQRREKIKELAARLMTQICAIQQPDIRLHCLTDVLQGYIDDVFAFMESENAEENTMKRICSSCKKKMYIFQTHETMDYCPECYDQQLPPHETQEEQISRSEETPIQEGLVQNERRAHEELVTDCYFHGDDHDSCYVDFCSCRCLERK